MFAGGSFLVLMLCLDSKSSFGKIVENKFGWKFLLCLDSKSSFGKIPFYQTQIRK